MKRLRRVLIISLCVFLVTVIFSLLSPSKPKLKMEGSSTTRTEDGWIIEGQTLYQRGYASGISDYSITAEGNTYSGSQTFEVLESGAAVQSSIRWKIDWARIVGNYAGICIVVFIVISWWNQKEPHQPA